MKVTVGYTIRRPPIYYHEPVVYPDRAAALAAASSPDLPERLWRNVLVHGTSSRVENVTIETEVGSNTGIDRVVRQGTLVFTNFLGCEIRELGVWVTEIEPVQVTYEGSPGAIAEALRNALAEVALSEYTFVDNKDDTCSR